MAKIPLTPVHELFERHLCYVINMIHGTIIRAGKSKDEVENYALMDAFCTYARSLIEFFKKRGREFTDKQYVPFAEASNLDAIVQRLNTQVAHLIYDGRVDDSAEKIDGNERFRIYEILRAEIVNFNKRAQTDRTLPELPGLSIDAIDRASATNVIQTIGPWPIVNWTA